MFQAVSPPITRSSKTVHTASGICRTCLLLPLAWVSLKICLQRCNCDLDILLSITNKIERYTIFFIIVSTLRVSGGFSAHNQELKNCTHSIGYMSSLFTATASGSSKQAADDGRRNRLKHVEH